MSYEFGWARYPMINRVKDVAAFTSMSVICGTRSFIDTGIGQKIVELRRGSFVDVHVSLTRFVYNHYERDVHIRHRFMILLHRFREFLCKLFVYGVPTPCTPLCMNNLISSCVQLTITCA